MKNIKYNKNNAYYKGLWKVESLLDSRSSISQRPEVQKSFEISAEAAAHPIPRTNVKASGKHSASYTEISKYFTDTREAELKSYLDEIAPSIIAESKDIRKSQNIETDRWYRYKGTVYYSLSVHERFEYLATEDKPKIICWIIEIDNEKKVLDGTKNSVDWIILGGSASKQTFDYSQRDFNDKRSGSQSEPFFEQVFADVHNGDIPEERSRDSRWLTPYWKTIAAQGFVTHDPRKNTSEIIFKLTQKWKLDIDDIEQRIESHFSSNSIIENVYYGSPLFAQTSAEVPNKEVPNKATRKKFSLRSIAESIKSYFGLRF